MRAGWPGLFRMRGRGTAVAVVAVSGAVVSLVPPVHASPGAVPSVTATGVVSSGPHVGSATHSGAGDIVRFTYAVNPAGTGNPYATTTVALQGPQDLRAGSVAAPDGTAVAYSTDGATYTAGQAGARFVRFAGALPSGAGGVAVPLAGPSTTFGTGAGGDGYVPILTGDRVFNVWHGGLGKVDCHVIATGASCPGYPFGATVGGSRPGVGEAVIGMIDPAHPSHLWYAGQRQDAGHLQDIGFVCVDVTRGASPSDCGWVTVSTTAPSAVGYSQLEAGGTVGGKLYSIDVSGLVYCLDPAAGGGAGAACGGYPGNVGLPAATDTGGLGLTPIPSTTRLIARTNSNSGPGGTRRSTLACLDTATHATCAGWGSGAGALRAVPNTPDSATADRFAVDGDVIPVQAHGGTWDAFCGSTNNSHDINTVAVDLSLHCYNLSDGTTRGAPPGLDDVLPDTTAGWHFGDFSTGHVTAFGSRVYLNLVNQGWTDDAAVCYDFSAGAVCPNYPYHFPQDQGGHASDPLLFYGPAMDTTGSCLWYYGDGRQFVFATPADLSKACGSSTTSATSLPVVPAHSYCGTDESGPSWDAISLRGLATNAYATAAVTVRDAVDAAVGGYDGVALPVNQTLDISGIPKVGNTATLTVTVAFTGIDPAAFNSGHAAVQTTWSGGAPTKYCLETRPAGLTCASGPVMRTDALTTVRPLSGDIGTDLSTSNRLTSTDSVPRCAVTATPLTSTGVGPAPQHATATVPSAGSARLLHASGPSNTVTAAGQGKYTMDNVTGVITFTPEAGFHGTATPVPYRLVDGYGNTGDATYTPTVTLPPPPVAVPQSSNGAAGAIQSVTVAVPPGGALALLDPTGSPVTTLTVDGVGTYLANPSTGDITFTAAARFAGLAPSVTYRITDAYGQARTGTYSAEVLAGQLLGVTGTHIAGIMTTGLYLIALGGGFLAVAWLLRRRRAARGREVGAAAR